jgi:hypothetical protein
LHGQFVEVGIEEREYAFWQLCWLRCGHNDWRVVMMWVAGRA